MKSLKILNPSWRPILAFLLLSNVLVFTYYISRDYFLPSLTAVYDGDFELVESWSLVWSSYVCALSLVVMVALSFAVFGSLKPMNDKGILLALRIHPFLVIMLTVCTGLAFGIYLILPTADDKGLFINSYPIVYVVLILAPVVIGTGMLLHLGIKDELKKM